MKTVLTFGTFDGLHDGHRAMLSQAKKLGDKLIVAVPKSENVEEMKGTVPQHSEQIRKLLVQAENIADQIVESDKEINSWNILKAIKPDIVAIGYDQIEMEKSLRKFIKENSLDIELAVLESYKPSELHNSILKTK